ncbi:unnamed protein product [Aphanomyces euteiches]
MYYVMLVPSSIAQDGLTELPKTIPYGQLAEFYGWENNFTKIENIDFRNANEVKFTSVPTLTSLVNVSFSTKLTKLYVGNLAIMELTYVLSKVLRQI